MPNESANETKHQREHKNKKQTCKTQKCNKNFAKTNIVQVIKTDNCLVQFKKSAIKTNKLLKSISNAIEAKSRNRSQIATRGKNSPAKQKSCSNTIFLLHFPSNYS